MTRSTLRTLLIVACTVLGGVVIAIGDRLADGSPTAERFYVIVGCFFFLPAIVEIIADALTNK